VNAGLLRERTRALRAAWIPLVQTAAAAGIAWFFTHDVLRHRTGFFAPVAAVIALGLGPGAKTRRTVEMVVGVAVGVAVGELLIKAIGTGPLQIGLVVVLAFAATVVLGGGPVIASQAATSAVLVATIRPIHEGLVPTRFIDALVGGAVGIAILALAPRDPARAASRAAAPVFAALSGTLDDIAMALETRDIDRATAALDRARGGDRIVEVFREALVGAAETARIAPFHWRDRERVSGYERSAPHLELAVRNARVIARAAVRAVELEDRISARLPDALRMLSSSVTRLEHDLDHGGERDRIRQEILSATAIASGILAEQRGFALDVLVGQIRSLGTDLLGTTGLGQQEAVDAIRDAAGEPAGRRRRSPARR